MGHFSPHTHQRICSSRVGLGFYADYAENWKFILCATTSTAEHEPSSATHQKGIFDGSHHIAQVEWIQAHKTTEIQMNAIQMACLKKYGQKRRGHDTCKHAARMSVTLALL